MASSPPVLRDSSSAMVQGAVEYGEVFTRRWMVEFMLDLIGYVPEVDLGGRRLVEPSCGTGAFLVPIIERLLTSARAHGRDPRSLHAAVRAYDLVPENAELTRKALYNLLLEATDLDEEEAEQLAARWVITGDFLLAQHVAGSADFVVGNPPYIRLENVPRATMDRYRTRCITMRGRADVYVGFIEIGLDLLAAGGVMSYICADRWMRNQYGADLRERVGKQHAVDAVVSLHDVEAFENTVSAYPAVTLIRRGPHRSTALVSTTGQFDSSSATEVSAWVRTPEATNRAGTGYDASRVATWFTGRDSWPTGTPAQLGVIADLESRLPPLEDAGTGTRVGIGVATGCDEVFLTRDPDLVETERLLPLLQAPDITGGSVAWSGTYLVNPWDESGLVDLGSYPRMAEYLLHHQDRLRRRHIARRRPDAWYRTIDRVDVALSPRAKLTLPDMKAVAHPVIDNSGLYPHHNLYFITSRDWDLDVLGGILLSDIANLFVGAYCVRMRGGTYRFQAQYLRRIRVPHPSAIPEECRVELSAAFQARDVRRANQVAAALYGVPGSVLDSVREAVSGS